MSPPLSSWRVFVGTLLVAVAPGFTSQSHAGTDPLIATAKSYERDACTVVNFSFNSPVAYVSHSPPAGGDELHIELSSAKSRDAGHQTLHPAASDAAAVAAAELDYRDTGAGLTVYFRRSVAYRIKSGSDGQSIAIMIGGRSLSTSCDAMLDEIASSQQKAQDAQPAAQPGELAIARAREALAKQNPQAATAELTAILEGSDRRHHQEALELYGVALEAKGQKVQAKAEFEDYLHLYPSGEGSERVKKRLAALEAAVPSPQRMLQTTSDHADAATPAQQGALPPQDGSTRHSDVLDGTLNGKSKVILTDGSHFAHDTEATRDGWDFGYSGSLSTYYERNQGGQDFFTPTQLRLGWDKDRIDQVYAEDMLSAFDYQAHFSRSGFAAKVRVSGAEDHSYLYNTDRYNIGALYFDANWTDEGLSGRVGRMTRYTGGVLGRFDGGLVSYKTSDALKFNAVAGSPTEHTYDQPFENDRYFYGASVDYAPWGRGKNVSLFFIDQRRDGLIDRQGVGAEVQYVDDSITAFATTDFDVHYNELNSALLTGTQGFADHSTFMFNFDYRRSPLIFTTNAMQGQAGLSLAQLLTKYSLEDIERFAVDRTAQSYVATLGYSYPLAENLLLNLDGTATYLSGTHSSAGVEGAPSTGVEFYGLAELVATSVLVPGDALTGGVRYADTEGARRYAVEASVRYPLAEDWRISPLMTVGYVDYTGSAQSEIQIMPTLRASYMLTKDLIFDLEAGEKWILRDTEHGRTNEDELLILTGVRYEFRSDKW